MYRRFVILLFLFLIIYNHPIVSKNKIIKPKLKANNLLEKRIKKWILELDKKDYKIFLGKLKSIGEVCIPYLSKVVKNKNVNKNIRERALLSIVEIKPVAYYGVLINILEDKKENQDMRLLAASLLGGIQKRDVLKVLSKYSQSGNEKISRTASYSLLKFNDRKIIPYLIILLKHWDRDISRKAYMLLLKVSGRYETDMYYESWKRWWDNYKDIFQGPN